MHMKRQVGRSILPRESALAHAVRLALGALGVSAALGMLGSGALAQEQGADTEPAQKKMQRVEITGSAIKRLESETALPVQIITSGPDNGLQAIYRAHLAAINAAQERVWLTTPYFVPTEAALAALTLG